MHESQATIHGPFTQGSEAPRQRKQGSRAGVVFCVQWMPWAFMAPAVEKIGVDTIHRTGELWESAQKGI